MSSRLRAEEVKPSVRAKYTAVDVSQNYAVLGASTGSLYFYERHSMNFISMYTNPDIKDSLTLVKISPDESKVAIATSKGTKLVLILRSPSDCHCWAWARKGEGTSPGRGPGAAGAV